MLYDGLEAVERLIQLRLGRLARVHLRVERVELRPHIRKPRREGAYRLALAALVALGLQEAGDVAGDGLAPVVYEAHFYDFVHVELREFPGEQQRHAGEAEAVLRDALAPERMRPAVAGAALQVLKNVEEIHKLRGFQAYQPLSAMMLSRPGGKRNILRK